MTNRPRRAHTRRERRLQHQREAGMPAPPPTPALAQTPTVSPSPSAIPAVGNTPTPQRARPATVADRPARPVRQEVVVTAPPLGPELRRIGMVMLIVAAIMAVLYFLLR